MKTTSKKIETATKILLVVAFGALSGCDLISDKKEMEPAKQTEMNSSTGEESAPDRD